MRVFTGTNESQVLNYIPSEYLLPSFPEFFPFSIPRDLSDRIIRLHGDPHVWWVSQLFQYIFRFQPRIETILKKQRQNLNLTKPIVG